MGFIYFVLNCVDVLAWPSFALGYPLYASIRAIETNSNDHMHELITYWILFSLISLFELAFAKLIEWVPIWPYIKLVVICSLVLPRFKGAYYAYKSFVQPCLTANLEEAIKKLSKPQETENFLCVAERYVKENGTEALEKLIATKGSIPKADVEEIKAIANAEEKVLAPVMQVKSADVNLDQTDNKAINATVEDKKMTISPPAGGEKAKALLLEAPLQKVQKEWTCAMCQVRASSETSLKDHLRGMRHKATFEQLKAIKQTTKNKASSSSSASGKSVQVLYCDSKKSKLGEGVLVNQSKTKKEEKNIQVQVNNYKNWCAICNVFCTREADLLSHLSGRKHLSRVQELTAYPLCL